MKTSLLNYQRWLVWTQLLTGWLLSIGAGFIFGVSIIQYFGSSLDFVYQTWFNQPVTNSTVAYAILSNSGLAAIISFVVTIIGTKLASDSPAFVRRLSDESIVTKNAEGARFALQDLIAELKQNFVQVSTTADAASELVAHRKRLNGRIALALADIADMDPSQVQLLDVEEIVTAEGMLKYAQSQIQKEDEKNAEIEALISDLETAIRLFQDKSVTCKTRRNQLRERLSDARSVAQKLLDEHQSSNVTRLTRDAAE